MRRLALILVGGAVWLLLAAIPVFADGGPHVLTVNNGSAGITADSCAGCHRAHTSQSPTGMLLTDPSATITGYCRSCHGATGTGAATDVDTGVQYALAGDGSRAAGTTIGALRSGGFLSARIGSSSGSRNIATPGGETKNAFIPVLAASQPVTSAHLAVPGSGLTATNIVWGNGGINSSVYGPTLGSSMECTACHNPHGNGNYRILDAVPTLPATATGSPAAVVQALVGTRVAGPPASYSSWTPKVGQVVLDSTYVAGRQKNYTVIAKAPAGTENYNSGNGAAPAIPQQPESAYLLYTDQLGAYAGNAQVGDYLKKFLTYDVDEEAVAGQPISNFYDGPNGHPNQGGFTSTGGRYTDFPENLSGTATGNYNGFGYQMTLWCTQCHTRYLGWSSSRSTPSGDNTYMYRHSTSKYRVCSTCHVAHGSNAIMNLDTTKGTTFSGNLKFPDGSAHIDLASSGNSRLLKLDNRGICLECHDPTGTATGQQGPAPVNVP